MFFFSTFERCCFTAKYASCRRSKSTNWLFGIVASVNKGNNKTPNSEQSYKGKVNLTNKGNNKITELRTILQRESQNSQVYKQTREN